MKISISKIQDHIRYLKSEENYKNEYKFIEEESKNFSYNYSISQKYQNENRYVNVLPNENSRVKLNNGLYINANYLPGLIQNSEKAYIATQGPLLNTINQFWEMIWETNSSVIVMLTSLYEGGKEKCCKFWIHKKDSPEKEFGNIKLSFISQEKVSQDIEKLEFELSLENQKKTTHLLLYNKWKDHNVPTDMESFAKLVKTTNQLKMDKTITVLCSAGLGRTGTFCTIHANLEKN